MMRRLIIAAAFAAAAAFSATTAWLLGSPDRASAYCSGQGQPTSLIETWGYEQSSLGTCNGDYEYRGGVFDRKTDGKCVDIDVKIDGVWMYTYARSCQTTGTAYNFTDANRWSPFQMCKSDNSTCVGYYWNSQF